MQVTVYPDGSGHAVECITNDVDGSIEKAIFYGSKAKEQAERYADTEYAGQEIQKSDKFPEPKISPISSSVAT